MNQKANYPKALEYYQEYSKILIKKYGLREEALIDLGNMGNLYADLGNYEKAMKFIGQSLEMAEAIGSKYDILSAKFSLANVRFKSGNEKAAVSELEQVLERLDKTWVQRYDHG
ncbi:MAG: tetratricopeptide repeat protein [Cyclobacteriaceae bacterium]|nr:tetratricopeptide repeat protein [Cyclobacteriaceae bacterium]